ncbi:hypothetical protein AB0M20_43985 [Actinoplanes sp. NPDC051633]|uniref:hypothetical protein n=1 Tax=Actinoplanes sp. NPDC051633 TaxID=3155670 RepID=UPI0034323791
MDGDTLSAPPSVDAASARPADGTPVPDLTRIPSQAPDGPAVVGFTLRREA